MRKVRYPQDPSQVSLHDHRYGSAGPPIAFCHGLFGQGRNWTMLGKRVAHDHRVVLVDMPNHGRSDDTHDFDYPEHAEIVAHHLRGIEADEPWRLVGHSMGGKIAMMVALLHPDLVERLVVVDMSPVSYTHTAELHRYALAMRDLDLRTLSSRVEADELLSAAVPNAEIRAFLLQNLRRDHGHWRWLLNIDLLADRLDQLAGWPQTEAVYRGPVLWIAGSESGYIQPEYAEQMREHFPSTRLVTIKDAGHWVHSEKPDVFSETLRAFLDQPMPDRA